MDKKTVAGKQKNKLVVNVTKMRDLTEEERGQVAGGRKNGCDADNSAICNYVNMSGG